MASGVKVSDHVKALFQEMKVINTDDDEQKRLRFALFVIKDGEIIEESSIREEDLKDVKDHFKHFESKLPANHCRYALYDCHYQTSESSKKEDLVFFMWTPDSADIKEKMSYASSKGPLAKVFTGIKHIKQINDPTEYCLEFFADVLGKNITSIEGCSVKRCHKKGY